MKIILLFILLVLMYVAGEENGKKDTTKLIKQYLTKKKNI